MENNSQFQITTEKLQKCWGKTDPFNPDPQQFHPALYHMLDVGHVAQILLSDACPSKWVNTISNSFLTNPDVIRSLFPFFIALHDIGKISATFQRVNADQYARLKKEGFQFGQSSDLLHTEVSRNFIRFERPDVCGLELSTKDFRVIEEMSAGHHGRFISSSKIKDTQIKLRMEEPPLWKELRLSAFSALLGIFIQPGIVFSFGTYNMSAAALILTGFTTLCDWIGSDQRFFTPEPKIDLIAYNILSLKRAREAVYQDGFSRIEKSTSSASFSALFPALTTPRPLQLAIDDIPDAILCEPSLTVIEAPTGEGKTEAALALAHRIALLRGFEEFYYALPTMATSNQMFIRVQNFLHEQLGLGISAKLVHGQSFLQQDLVPVVPLSNGEENQGNLSMDWFNSKKKALLAPFGVGTIDQIELGALNVRHSSLRLSGLAGKVVILDEVHAYDTYMTTIIVRLLEWLRTLGTSVILLSATLPQSRREQLIRGFSPNAVIPTNSVAYPLVMSVGENDLQQLTPAAESPQRQLGLEFLDLSGEQNKEKASWLLRQIENGGIACWITNTVERAQQLCIALQQSADDNVEILLIHARYPLAQREELEKQVVERVGPEKTHRSAKLVVIGTQVLEQSLDLDFDLMVSDLAPIDLLLQRAGRLHRHANTPSRGSHTKPVLYLNIPLKDGQPEIHIDSYVYDAFLLLRTWQVIKDLNNISLPADYRRLVEEVYNSESIGSGSDLSGEYVKLLRKEEFAREEAEQRLLPQPNPDTLFTSLAARLVFEEDETRAGWTVAQTRLGERSINLIPLEDHGEYCTLPGETKCLPKHLPLDKADQIKLLRHQIKLNRNELIDPLSNQDEKSMQLFNNSPLLRDVHPLWLHNRKAEIATAKGAFVLELDPILGLTIIKNGG
ncbi:MAG: CRISPR-associated helicase Cas3' [Anaerolineaceae bacterium]|nr:CRISPR-associated helicase Cas3' [Anaerolineaceae bacterium]